jgi:hypothetical protein
MPQVFPVLFAGVNFIFETVPSGELRCNLVYGFNVERREGNKDRKGKKEAAP